MKFLFDQNISHKILKSLSETFDGSMTVKQQDLMNASDFEIWEFAKRHNLVIVTQDSDFNDLNSLYGFPPKIIWIRTGNQKTKAIAQLLNEYSGDIQQFLNDDDLGCFEISKLK